VYLANRIILKVKISGFTFVRNAITLDFPLKESVLSILPLVDEYVIAYSPGNTDDGTLDLIKSIGSEKIKVVEAKWEPEKFYRNTLYAHLTDIAKANCSGDWLFYLQGDEAVHESSLSVIKKACLEYLVKDEIEGLLFEYRHFWGDYAHCFTHHGWYPREIRIIRNKPEIHSWRDAQSFRIIYNFKSTAEDYLKKTDTRKLRVVAIPVYIYHYGWVRNPTKMREKQNRMIDTFNPKMDKIQEHAIDYGPLNNVPKFKGQHPKVMTERIKRLNWQDSLQKAGKPNPNRPKYKHEKIKYRLRTWLEINLLGGNEIGGFKNYTLVEKWRP
jgi:hypothetical protein